MCLKAVKKELNWRQRVVNKGLKFWVEVRC